MSKEAVSIQQGSINGFQEASRLSLTVHTLLFLTLALNVVFQSIYFTEWASMVSTIIPTAYRATVCIMCSAAVVVKPNFHTDTNATCDLSLVRP